MELWTLHVYSILCNSMSYSRIIHVGLMSDTSGGPKKGDRHSLTRSASERTVSPDHLRLVPEGKAATHNVFDWLKKRVQKEPS